MQQHLARGLGDLESIAADLHELGDLARSFGLSVGYEALAWGRHVNDYRQAWEAVRRAVHGNVGLVLDSYHLLAKGLPVEDIGEFPADRIVLVQIADAPGIEMDLLHLSRHYRCLPGQGDLPVPAMLRKLEEIGYQGPVSHEIFSDDFRASSTRRIAIDGMRSFLWLDEQVRSRTPPAALPVIDGIEFIEFVDDRNQAGELGGMLRGLGFAEPIAIAPRTSSCIARARSTSSSTSRTRVSPMPSTSCMAFGRRDGAARRRCRARGGTRDRHARQAVRRADRQGRARDPGRARRERQPRLLHRPAGRARHVLRCRLRAGSGARGAAGPRPHRASTTSRRSCPQAELLSWVLYYKTIFGLEPAERADLSDPRGLIVSRAMTNQDRTLRLPINASQARTTAAGPLHAADRGRRRPAHRASPAATSSPPRPPSRPS